MTHRLLKCLSLLIFLSFMLLQTSCMVESSILDLQSQLLSLEKTDIVVNSSSYLPITPSSKKSYTFQILSGEGSIDQATGLFTAPSTPQQVTVRIEDNKGKYQDFLFNVYQPLHSASSITSNGSGKSSVYNFYPTGGVPPYSFHSLSDTIGGVLDSLTGAYSFTMPFLKKSTTVEVRDSIGNTTTVTLGTKSVTISGSVNSIVVDNGYAYIGGSFTYTNPTYLFGITNYHKDLGTPQGIFCEWEKKLDDNSTVADFVESSDSIYAAGSFTSFGGVAVNNLIKINKTTCQLDTAFSQSSGFDSSVTKILVSGNSVYAIGYFTNYRGAPANYLAKLNTTNGNLDTTFTQSTGADGFVNTFLISGSSLYIGGNFTNYRGVAAQRIAKLDLTSGNLDTTFGLSTGFNAPVFKMELSGGSLYAGGAFGTYRSVAANYLAKLNPTNGNLDTAFTQSTGFNGQVQAISIQGSSIYVGGDFTSYRSVAANYLAKLDTTAGNLDTTFTQSAGFDQAVNSVIASDTSIYVGGNFTTYRSLALTGIAKLTPDTGLLDQTFSSAIKGQSLVTNLILRDNNFYVLLDSARVLNGGDTVKNLAKIDLSTGNLDTTFTQATSFNNTVNTILVVGSSVYVGGSFTTYRGSAAQRLAKLDTTSGNLDTTFTQTTGASGTVRTLGFGSGFLYAGGDFTTYRGTTALYLAKINPTSGVLDTTFTKPSGASAAVYSLLVDGSNIYIGGAFTFYRGSSGPARRLTKLETTNGNRDTTFTLSTGFDGAVNKIVKDSSGAIYVGGGFATYRGATAMRIAKLDPTTGDLDTTFTQATAFESDSVSVSDMTIIGSSLYAVGTFKTYRGVPVNYIAKIDTTSGNLDTTFTQPVAFNYNVNCIFATSGSILVGGYFSIYRFEPAAAFLLIDPTTGNSQ